MNVLWEIVIRAQQQGIAQHELFFAQAGECSPWYEQSFSVLNEERVEAPVVELNSLYRFADLFQALLHELKDSSYARYLFDAAVHLLAQQERCLGLSRREIYVRRLCEELQQGEFGASAAQIFRRLAQRQQEQLASFLLAQYEAGASLLLFRRVLRTFYPQSLLYQEREQPWQLLWYPGTAAFDEALALLLQELFLPLRYRLRIFSSGHFGVWDVDATLVLDELEIY